MVVKNRANGMRYLKGIPRAPIPQGRFLVHNHIKPARPLGTNGFPAWAQNDGTGLVECRCDFGGCNNAELHKHYRIKRARPSEISS
jgi:hypothetical protein